MKYSFLLLSLSTSLIFSACQFTSISQDTDASDMPMHDGEEWTEEEMMEMEMMEEEHETSSEEVYMDFTQETYESLLGEKPFALFFHAPWCPTCQFMEKDILSNLDGFPEGSIILKADFDTETELKKKYNISSQSTMVMINADGTIANNLVAPSAKTLQASFTNLLK